MVLTACRRVLRLVAVVIVVTFVTYALLDATPGDPILLKLGNNPDPAAVDELRAEMGLDRPLVVRYLDWLASAARLDFGESVFTQTPVRTLLGEALPKTIELMILGELFAIAIAVPLALRAARRPGGLIDRCTSASAFALLALPSFVLALYLAFIFGVKLGWFPTIVTDLPSFFTSPIGNLHQMLLPSLALALPLAGVLLRILRNDLVATLQEDYVLLAQARGLSERRIMWYHVLRPSSTNLITAIGLNVAGLIGGAVVIQQVFSINGIGQLFVGSIIAKEFAIAATVVLLLTLAFAFASFIVDVLYALVDPRVRHGAAR